MNPIHAEERAVALRAVRRAAAACRRVQQTLVASEAVRKKDRSPVTIADFASQALVCEALGSAFPDDAVVAEEDAAVLRGDPALRSRTLEVVGEAMGRPVEADELLGWIDRGSAPRPSSGRFWTLDPIDGTKGFLRGEQYAVALALLDASGELLLGVLGCPSLPDGSGDRGVLIAAVRGAGAVSLGAFRDEGEGRPVRVRDVTEPSDLRLCESVEPSHSDHDTTAQIASRLGVRAEPLRIDSQAKYASVARGDADVYLRLPTRPDYSERIWDHAAGALVVEEAGGIVSDVAGRPLDFSQGEGLPAACGVVAAPPAVHAAVIEAVLASRR
jgi:HAL2 family 3'(2'),5'-bisphosphate nucleotidase